MKFRYELGEHWIEKVSMMEEFANGGTQVTIKTKDGKIYKKILISNATWIVAMRGYSELPFKLEEIVEIFQTDEDKNPLERRGWQYWDEWK